jgi:hypothetical protein
MPCYIPPPPPVPHWLVRLAYVTLGTALFAGMLAAFWVMVHLVAAILGGAP